MFTKFTSAAVIGFASKFLLTFFVRLYRRLRASLGRGLFSIVLVHCSFVVSFGSRLPSLSVHPLAELVLIKDCLSSSHSLVVLQDRL
ncbi:hypothetical protein BGZ57DRAFT_919517 [Hyaloscypha finlandica]|nr:hypothetical protein BGZ57DRAFT_919517 [Hyaloscypha finlandica]